MNQKVTNIFFIQMLEELVDTYKRLRIKAIDVEDLKVFSSHFQDALCPIVSMVNEKQTFTLLANRFCWEVEKEESNIYYRVHSGICVKYVNNIFHKELTKEKRILNLLAIQLIDDNNLHFIFSENYELCIQISKLEIYANDLHQPWPTAKRPTHLHEHLRAVS